MKVFELYKKGKPIKATFFLFMGICSVGIILVSIMNMIIAGILMGLFFAYLNFSWLPSLDLEEKENNKTISQEKNQSEAVNTSKVEESPAVNNIPKIEEKPKIEVERSMTNTNTNISTSKNKNAATAEELSDNFVLVQYKKHKWYMSQNTPKTLADMPKKDSSDKFVPSGAKEKMFEAYVNFKPITREGDSRHIIKLDHYDYFDIHSNTIREYFKMLDDSFMDEQVNPYVDEYHNPAIHAEYAKVKVNRKYEKTLDDGTKDCYVELADLEDKFIFEDEIGVKTKYFDDFEEGKECAVIRIGWGVFFDDMNVYVAMKLEDVEKYIKK